VLLVSLAILILFPLVLAFLLRPALGPEEVLSRYVRAAYARDFVEAYRWISRADQRLKDEAAYVREQGAFEGFALSVAKRIADFIEMKTVKKEIQNDHALVTLHVKLPDANALSDLLLDWDEEKLNALGRGERKAILKTLDQRLSENKVASIETTKDFKLSREENGWRLFLDWAAGVRVAFKFDVTDSLPLAVEPVRQEVIAQPGEPFTITFRVKNSSDREIPIRIAHLREPKAVADYIELVACGLISPMKLPPGGSAEYFSTYLVRGDLPPDTRWFAVTYQFKNEMS
jgi:hypothetical protein